MIVNEALGQLASDDHQILELCPRLHIRDTYEWYIIINLIIRIHPFL